MKTTKRNWDCPVSIPTRTEDRAVTFLAKCDDTGFYGWYMGQRMLKVLTIHCVHPSIIHTPTIHPSMYPLVSEDMMPKTR